MSKKKRKEKRMKKQEHGKDFFSSCQVYVA